MATKCEDSSAGQSFDFQRAPIVVVADVDTRALNPLTAYLSDPAYRSMPFYKGRPPDEHASLAWSPDGRMIAVPFRDHVVLVDLDSNFISAISFEEKRGKPLEEVTWSPDGNWLVLYGIYGETWYLVSVDGSQKIKP